MKLLFLAAFVSAQDHDSEAMAFCNNYCQDKVDMHYPDTGYCLNGTYFNPKGIIFKFFKQEHFQIALRISAAGSVDRLATSSSAHQVTQKALNELTRLRAGLEWRIQDLRLAIQSPDARGMLRAFEVNFRFTIEINFIFTDLFYLIKIRICQHFFK